MRIFRISPRTVLLTVIEFSTVAASLIAACYLSFDLDASIYLFYEGGLQRAALFAAVFTTASYVFDLYKVVRVRSRIVVALQILRLIGATFIVEATFAYISPDLTLPPAVVITGSGLILITMLLWRIYLRPTLWRALKSPQVLFVGTNAAVLELARVIRERPLLELGVTGYVADEAVDEPALGPRLGRFDELTDVLASRPHDRIVVGMDEMNDRSLMKRLFDLRLQGREVEDAAGAYEAVLGRVYSPAIRPWMLVFRDELTAGPGSLALQSIYTNLLALVGILVSAPLTVAIAILLKIWRKGPVFHMQQCVGLNGIPFNLIRFRCSPTGRDFISRVLLKLHLSGLPQAFNIIRGEMSLIGPRADRTEFADSLSQMIPFYRQRFSVKPGIIGWAQMNSHRYPQQDTIARMEYDLYYIKHISLILDAYVVVSGIKMILLDVLGEPE